MSEENKAPEEKQEKPEYQPPRSVRDPDLAELSADAERNAIEAEKKFLRAGVEFDKGDVDEALMLIRAALALVPGNSKYHYNAGFLYWRKGLLEVALNHYKLFVRYAAANDKDLDTIKGRIIYLEKEIKKQYLRR